MRSEPDARWISDDGRAIATWLDKLVKKRGSLEHCDHRQLIWVAKILQDGSESARDDLLSLLDMQSNMLMLTFGGATGFFAMLAPDSTSPWQSLLLLVGCVAMVLPLFGTVLVLIFAGNIRWISQPAFLDFVLENRVLTSAVAPCIILSGLAFTLFLVLTVG